MTHIQTLYWRWIECEKDRQRWSRELAEDCLSPTRRALREAALIDLTNRVLPELRREIEQVEENVERIRFAIEQGFFDEHNETLFQIWRAR